MVEQADISAFVGRGSGDGFEWMCVAVSALKARRRLHFEHVRPCGNPAFPLDEKDDWWSMR